MIGDAVLKLRRRWRRVAADPLEPSMGAYMDAARWASDELDRVERRMQSYIRPVQRRAPVALMNFREGSPHLAQRTRSPCAQSGLLPHGPTVLPSRDRHPLKRWRCRLVQLIA